MASTARKIKLDTAKKRRVRSVTLPMSSAGMSPPGPDPRPAGATEERAHDSQTKRNDDEPGHDPPGKRLGSQGMQPSFLLLPARIGQNQEGGDERRGNKNGPGVKDCKER